MFKRVLVFLVVAAASVCARADVTTFEGCTDAAGRSVRTEMDSGIAKIVQSSVENGEPVIRYNPQLLPGMGANSRLFFFAYECARFALGQPVGREMPAARQRQADCLAVETLVNSKLIGEPDGVRALQAELVFEPSAWAALPGSQRSFDFAACPKRSALKLPSAGPPSAGQTNWNTCVRVCGDRLRKCQTACRGESCVNACVATYDRCESTCKAE